MTGKTHIVGGVALASSITMLTGLYKPDTKMEVFVWGTMYLLPSVVGAWAPDFDHGNAKASNINIFTKIASILTRILFGHRGMIHSPFMLGVISVISYAAWKNTHSTIIGMILTGFLIGYGSHLLLDFINPEGIPLFFPFEWERESVRLVPKKHHIMGVKTGGAVEWVLKIGLLIICIGTIYIQVAEILI